MESLVAATSGSKPLTDGQWFSFHMGRTRNTSTANILFGLIALINNAVATSDKVYYSNAPLAMCGVWGGAWMIGTAVVYFVASSKDDRKLFKLLLFFLIISVPCGMAMAALGIRGMIKDFTTEWEIGGVNRPMDIIVAICGLIGFILAIMGCTSCAALLRLPLHCWDKVNPTALPSNSPVAQELAELRKNRLTDRMDSAPAAQERTESTPAAHEGAPPRPAPVQAAWVTETSSTPTPGPAPSVAAVAPSTSSSDGEQRPPPAYDNIAFNNDIESQKL